MKNLLLLVISAVALAACERRPETVIDQCMRKDIFLQCMKALPAGPMATMYNDWDEVVAQCENVAYYQSLRQASGIKAECRT